MSESINVIQSLTGIIDLTFNVSKNIRPSKDGTCEIKCDVK